MSSKAIAACLLLTTSCSGNCVADLQSNSIEAWISFLASSESYGVNVGLNGDDCATVGPGVTARIGSQPLLTTEAGHWLRGPCAALVCQTSCTWPTFGGEVALSALQGDAAQISIADDFSEASIELFGDGLVARTLTIDDPRASYTAGDIIVISSQPASDTLVADYRSHSRGLEVTYADGAGDVWPMAIVDNRIETTVGNGAAGEATLTVPLAAQAAVERCDFASCAVLWTGRVVMPPIILQ